MLYEFVDGVKHEVLVSVVLDVSEAFVRLSVDATVYHLVVPPVGVVIINERGKALMSD